MNKKRESYKHLLQLVLSSLNILGQIAIFVPCYYCFYSTWFKLEYEKRGDILFNIIYAAAMFLFAKMYGVLRIGYKKNGEIISSSIISTLIVNFFTYFMLSLLCGEIMNLVYYTPMTILQLLWAVISTILSSLIYKAVFPPRSLIIIHGDRPTDDIVRKFESRKDKFSIGEMVHINEGFENIVDKLDDYGGVVIWDINAKERNRILKYCYAHNIRVYIMPKISDVILSGAEQLHLFDSPIMLTREYSLTIEQRFVKRAVDIAFALILIVLSSPFMLITAIMVKLYDRGPILYKQVRCTEGMREFKILKFRSMRTDAEKDGVARLAKANDDRITPVGKFIRKCRLDELPQLFNILKGDMSFIGPRPERPEIISQYVKEMPEFVLRTRVRAGLAGYAQVYGKYNTTPYDKLKLDLSYIENYSVGMDFKLMMLTIKVLFSPDATEGVAENQVTAMKTDANGNANS